MKTAIGFVPSAPLVDRGARDHVAAREAAVAQRRARVGVLRRRACVQAALGGVGESVLDNDRVVEQQRRQRRS